jgi:hypothetical protein
VEGEIMHGYEKHGVTHGPTDETLSEIAESMERIAKSLERLADAIEKKRGNL